MDAKGLLCHRLDELLEQPGAKKVIAEYDKVNRIIEQHRGKAPGVKDMKPEISRALSTRDVFIRRLNRYGR